MSWLSKLEEAIMTPELYPECYYERTEYKKLAKKIESFLKGEYTSNTLVFGATGSGKTTTVRVILYKIFTGGEYKMDFSTDKIIYVNPRIASNPMGIRRILFRCLATPEDYKKAGIRILSDHSRITLSTIFNIIKDRSFRVLLIIDEADKFFIGRGKNIDDLCHYLRVCEEKIPLTVIVITNMPTFRKYLKEDVRPFLPRYNDINFPPYNTRELHEILKLYAKRFIPEEIWVHDKYDKAGDHYYLFKIAKKTMTIVGRGDARIALQLLLTASMKAIEKNTKFTDKLIDEAVIDFKKEELLRHIESLPDDMIVLLYAMVRLYKKKGRREGIIKWFKIEIPVTELRDEFFQLWHYASSEEISVSRFYNMIDSFLRMRLFQKNPINHTLLLTEPEDVVYMAVKQILENRSIILD